ncbi:MAG TPA: hypothetical protein DEG69_22945 [Flavobacteriaceae bacterium]|nr:hypothetical protein [Flavobacteriaceae bacterium]
MNYVVFSHTEFSDILKVQTDYLKDIEDKFLFINKASNHQSCGSPFLNDLYSNYKDVIYYDDSLPYAGRIINCLTQLQQKHEIEFCLFLHDIDIVFDKDDEILNNCLEIMKKFDVHRIDLQYNPKHENKDEQLINVKTLESENDFISGSFYTRKDSTGNYAYNVNPSIWKIDYFLNLLKIDSNLGYRQIESDSRLQEYAKKVVNAHKITSNIEHAVHCGYFTCLPFFVFFHITHGGKLAPIDRDEEYFHRYRQFGENHFNVKQEYYKILKKYNLPLKRGHN